MRKWFRLLLVIAALLTAGEIYGETIQASEKTEKMLLIGNSMSSYRRNGKAYNIETPLEALAKQGGHKLEVTTIAHGGAWLKYYTKDSGRYAGYYRQLEQALSEEHWDYIVLQDYSLRILDSLDTTVYPALKQLKKRIRSYQPDAKLMLYMTYGYDNGRKKKVNGIYQYLTAAEMEQYLAAGYYELGERLKLPVIPVGMQLERCRRLYPKMELYAGNGRHAIGAGYYLAACVFYETLYHEKPDGTGLSVGEMTLETADRKKIEQLVMDRLTLNRRQLRLTDGAKKKLTVKTTDGADKMNAVDMTDGADNTISYQSMDKSIVAVNEKTGRIRAVQPGKTLVMAEEKSGLQAALRVYVRCKAPGKIQIEAQQTQRGKSIRLTWEKVTGARKYRIYRADKKNGSYRRIGTTKTTSYTDNVRQTGQRYYYKIKAVHRNKRCNSVYSRAVTAHQ